MAEQRSYSTVSIENYRIEHANSLSRVSSDPDTFDPLTKTRTPPSFTIDLDAVHALEAIVIHSRRNGREYCNRTLTVETSPDGTDWTTLHSGSLYWQDTLTIPASGAIMARYIRLGLTVREPLDLKKVDINVRMFGNDRLPVFAARQTDGLGGRLNGLLSAIWLSDLFNVDFGFSWGDKYANDPMHAIVPASSMFSRPFLDRHYAPSLDERKGWAISDKDVTRDEIVWNLARTGLIDAPRTDLLHRISGQGHTLGRDGLKRAFERIEFSDEIEDAIRVARATPIPKSAVAMHLRSGDIFYGIYRKQPNYSYKAITMPLAKHIIRMHVAQGHEVFLFGQDTKQLAYLARTCGAIDGSTLNHEAVEAMAPHQQAMYDLVLLSRFDTILAGTSAFAQQASWISGSKVIKPNNIFSAEEQHQASVEDLKENAHLYDPLQTAYSYWYAYHHGRHNRDIETNIEILRKAMAFDPDNELYALVLSALFARKGDIDQSAQVLETLFNDRKQTKRLADVFLTFTTRKSKHTYKMAEYFPDIYEPAKKGMFYHAALIFFLMHTKADVEKMERFFATCHDTAPPSALQRAIINYLQPRMTFRREQISKTG